ncbi:hypothetical protein TrLO_g1892 [Triparma laevis f. longispina]|uniref:PPM-type phosphatase domain-containing protein n=1 Tax=Triparma laevis f. longispina TaxID=1714387 RepID=A0A9W7KVR1_9STRA|nr:hypothetical protein TrLO_g1892 [Triparma laevis f. longispina]
MGTLLDKPVTEKEDTEEGVAHGLRYGVSSMQGWRVDMEDSHCYEGEFDGVAWRLPLLRLRHRILKPQQKYKDCVASPTDPSTLGSALQSCFLQIDVEMLLTPTMSSKKDRSGCTAVCVVVTPTHIICANAGDSRSCYKKSSGVVPLSDDHKPYNATEASRIETAGGYVSMKRVDESYCVQIKERSEEDEYIVIACDGIWGVCSNEECCGLVEEILGEGGGKAGLISEEMLDVCLERGSRDNMTCGVILFEGGGGVQARREKREEEAKALAKETEGEGTE